MFAWLDHLSPWLQISLICAVLIGVTWLGIIVVHPVSRWLLHRDEPSNEAIIFSAGNFGLFYAVLLGLLIIAIFQSTKDLENTIGREASELSTLYRTVDSYPDPFGHSVESQTARLHPFCHRQGLASPQAG